MLQKLAMAVAAATLLWTAGCRAVGPEAEAQLGITAGQLRVKSQQVLDPNGVLKNAKSFEMVTQVIEKGRNVLGHPSEKDYTEVVRYKEPHMVSMSEIRGVNQVNRIVSNLRGIWTISTTGHVKEITGQPKAAMEFALAPLNPKVTDDMLWRKVELEVSDRHPDSWYMLCLYPKEPIIRRQICYIDKKTFLTRMTVMELDAGLTATTEIVSYTTLADGVMMPSVVRDIGERNGVSIERRLLNLSINSLKPDCCCDFEADTPTGWTHPGCKACGPVSKTRKLYDYTH